MQSGLNVAGTRSGLTTFLESGKLFEGVRELQTEITVGERPLYRSFWATIHLRNATEGVPYRVEFPDGLSYLPAAPNTDAGG